MADNGTTATAEPVASSAEPAEPAGIAASAANLAAAVDRVAYSAGGPERPILGTVLFDPSAGGLRLVACDNYAIAYAPVRGAVSTGAAIAPFAIASADVARIRKALPRDRFGAEQTVTIAPAADGSIAFAWYGASMTVRPVDGQYPSWQTVVPAGEPQFCIAFSAELLADACKAALKDGDGNVLLAFGGPTGRDGAAVWSEDAATRPVRIIGETGAAVLMPCRMTATDVARRIANAAPAGMMAENGGPA